MTNPRPKEELGPSVCLMPSPSLISTGGPGCPADPQVDSHTWVSSKDLSLRMGSHTGLDKAPACIKDVNNKGTEVRGLVFLKAPSCTVWGCVRGAGENGDRQAGQGRAGTCLPGWPPLPGPGGAPRTCSVCAGGCWFLRMCHFEWNSLSWNQLSYLEIPNSFFLAILQGFSRKILEHQVPGI